MSDTKYLKMRKIVITEDALTDLVKMVNNASTDGLCGVEAELDDDKRNLGFELKYKSRETEGSIITRYINIPLRDD